MSAAVERVKLAVNLAASAAALGDRDAWAEAVARAAILALREPDEAMIMAAVGQWATREEAITIWATMIDTAALSAPQSGCEGGYSAVDAKAGGKG